ACADFVDGILLPEADAELRARLRRQDQPALFLAVGTRSSCRGLAIVRVNLDREALAGEQIFDEQARAFRRRLEPNLPYAPTWCDFELRRQGIAAPRLFYRSGGQEPRGHSPWAPFSDPTSCAPSALVTSTSLPSTTTITSSSPITETRGPSLSTSTFRQSTSSALGGARLPCASPPRACCTALHEPMSDHAMSAGTTAAFSVCSITA